MEIGQYKKDVSIYGRIAGKSSIAKKGIDIAAGVIDTDYRGIIYIVLINNNPEEYFVDTGDQIAQIIFEQYFVPQIQIKDDISETERMSSPLDNRELILFRLSKEELKENRANILALTEERTGIPKKRINNQLYNFDIQFRIPGCKEFVLRAILDTGATKCCVKMDAIPADAKERISYATEISGVNSVFKTE